MALTLNRTIYRITGILLAFAAALASYSSVQATPSKLATQSPKVYAYYYLWWSTKHWHDKLGSNYPYTASPLPLPATTDADGCNAVSNHPSVQLLDVPTALYSQDNPGVIENDIRAAKSAGISGFWLNWGGNGSSTQTRTSVTYTPRLAEAFAASSRVGNFVNWVSYKTSSMPSPDAIINDLNFLYAQFGSDPAWERIDGQPVLTLTGSRKYGNADLTKISNAVRDRFYLVGDESGSTLTDARLALFDGLTYYWSSQNPYTNTGSFTTIKKMGDKVHAAGKHWYPPITPGYNSVLIGGSTCIPRRNGDTIRALWNGNIGSNPDGWAFISWNEIAENTHIQPLQKWGSTSLNALSELIQSAPSVPTFADVPSAHPYHSEIEALYQAGFTAGCATNPLRYCPEQTMNRAESAVFVERGIHSTGYTPAAPSGQVFADLPIDSWAAPWVTALWEDQQTSGCGTDPLVYCPWQGHTRAEGSVFYLRMLNGTGFEPPHPARQTFADVSLNTWYARWVEAAYNAALIEPCQIAPEFHFCPDDALTRAVAAYMLVRAKGISLP